MIRLLWRFPRNPAFVYEDIRRRYGDVVELRDFRGRPWLFLACPHAVRQVHQANHRGYGRGRLNGPFTDFLGDGLLTSERGTWSRHRRVMNPYFKGEHQRRFLAAAGRQVDALVSQWESRIGRKEFNICPDIELLSYRVVAYTMFGLTDDDEAGAVHALDAALRHVSTNSFRMYKLPRWLTSLSRRRFRRNLARLERPVTAAIAAARALPEDDTEPRNLLMELIHRRHGFTDVEIRDEILTMIHAGQHTVASGIAFALHLIATHPDVEKKLLEEIADLGGRVPTVDDLQRMHYMDAVVDETLRLYPPAWGGVREAIADDELDGVAVVAGTPVVFSQYVTHRHPDLWSNPEEFLPERTDRAGVNDYRYFPFGGGPHLCIGQDVALLEMKLVIIAMLSRFELVASRRHKVRPLATLDLIPEGGVYLSLRERR